MKMHRQQQRRTKEQSSDDDDRMGGVPPVRRRQRRPAAAFPSALRALIVLTGAFLVLSNRELTRVLNNATNTQSKRQPQPPTPRRKQHPIDIEAIARKWNLTSPDAAYWLEQQVTPTAASARSRKSSRRRRRRPYNESADVLAFYQPLKTGGTSFSRLLSLIFSQEAVVPGSHESGRFNRRKYMEAAANATTATQQQQQQQQQQMHWDDNYRVLFSHTNFRIPGQAQSLLRIVPPHKRLRYMTLIRDPVSLRASNFYEWMCHVGRWVNERYNENGQECPEYVNLTDVADVRAGGTQGKQKILNGIHPYKHCQSIDNLLESDHYDTYLHDMFREHLLADDNNNENNDTGATISNNLETRALQDLGGFKVVDNSSQLALDYVYYGITERMNESICLFYYNLKLPAPSEDLVMPNERYKKCRPTDLWTSKHRQQVEGRKTFDYTIWRVANAIMDVRVATMQWELDERLAKGEALDYVAPGCYPLPT